MVFAWCANTTRTYGIKGPFSEGRWTHPQHGHVYTEILRFEGEREKWGGQNQLQSHCRLLFPYGSFHYLSTGCLFGYCVTCCDFPEMMKFCRLQGSWRNVVGQTLGIRVRPYQNTQTPQVIKGWVSSGLVAFSFPWLGFEDFQAPLQVKKDVFTFP